MTKKETHKPSLSATLGLNEVNNISLYNESQILVGSTIRKKSKNTCKLIKGLIASLISGEKLSPITYRK